MAAKEVRVAIVGGGPVGMTAAVLLAARGVDVQLFERNQSTSDEPKAISLDDEALRTLSSAGLARELLNIIVPGTGTKYYGADGALLFHAGPARPYRLGHPFKNPFAQPDLERVLLTALRDHPLVETRHGVEVLGLEGGPDHVTLSTSGGPVRAKYVLGCDGGRSTVRKACGIPMVGRSYDDVWLVADTVDDPHDERYGMHHGDPARPHVVVPGLNGRCRYEFLLRPGEGDAGGPVNFALLRELLRPYRDITADQVERAVNYRFHALVAQRWWHSRTFLAGDAAHLMPPFAGQGLNSGIRDVANLTWKLADVLAGKLREDVLSSYETERRPHVEAVVRLSQRIGRVVMTTSTRMAERRDALIRRAMSTSDGRAFFEQMRYRPAWELTDGLVLPSGVSGRQLGQPRVFDTRTRSVQMLDEIIGEGWSLLGVNMPPSAWASRAWAGLASLSARTADVWLDDRLPGGQPRRPTLVDVDSGMAAEFESYRGRFVLVRPDRFVAAACDPGGIDDMVRGVSGWLEGDPASGVGDNGRNVANAVHSLGGATTLSS